MTSEQIAELRQWCADADNGMGDGADADRGGVMLDAPVLRRLLDEREALLSAARAIYPEDAPVRTGAWEVRALADAIAKAESP